MTVACAFALALRDRVWHYSGARRLIEVPPCLKDCRPMARRT